MLLRAATNLSSGPVPLPRLPLMDTETRGEEARGGRGTFFRDAGPVSFILSGRLTGRVLIRYPRETYHSKVDNPFTLDRELRMIPPLQSGEPRRVLEEFDSVPPLGSKEEPMYALRPPLKWAGGKRWLVTHLQPLWQGHSEQRLVEPFVGGLAVTLGLLPKRALLNDANPHVVTFYRWLKRGLVVDMPYENSRHPYYAARSRFNELVQERKSSCKEAAELFYYLNRTCYNGLCRFNSSGGFNVPFGRYKTITYTRDFSHYLRAMKNWTLSVGDFEKVRLVQSDFVYADPPYDSSFTQYSKDSFTWEDQVRLARWLSSHEGPVVLSNLATPRIVKLYDNCGFRLSYLAAPRMINCTGDRTPAKEVLATRNL